MRLIIKGHADSALLVKHRNPPLTGDDARSRWDSFRSDKKRRTKTKCLVEQYNLCGYSEVDLSFHGLACSQELGMHLEHVEPKSLYPLRTFDHNNLIVSAIDDSSSRKLSSKDVFGGHAKQSWYNSALFISPLDIDCYQFFHYEISGLVVPKLNLSQSDEQRASMTIDKLNLNAPILVNWRAAWLSELDKEIAKLLNDDDALRRFAETELLPVGNCLRPFHSAQRQMFGALGERVVTESGLPI